MYNVLLVMKNGTAEAAICEVVETLDGVRVVGHASAAAEAGVQAGQLRPDLVLLSHDLEGKPLLATIQDILDQSPGSKVLVLSQYNDSQFALRSIAVGASGYMLQDRVFEELASAVETTMSGGVYLSPGVAGALPLAERKERRNGVPKNGQKKPVSESGRHSDRILVVDDEQDLRTAFRTILEGAGYVVTTASTAEDASRKIGAQLPDLIFLDLVMPESSGVQVLEEVRAMNDGPPVVIVTGYLDGDLMQQALEYSPLVVLAKPVSGVKLVDTARKVLAARKGVQP